MKRKCMILSWEDTSICAVERIENEFPCFVIIHDINEDNYEVFIDARIEDWASIERILAPFV